MRRARAIRRTLLTLVALTSAGSVAAYLMASWVPADYRPARLGREDRERATRTFYNRVFAFINEGEDVKPFAWSVDEDWMNRSLASMDEIAYQRGGKRGQVHRLMERTRLAEPAIALGDGEITLMVRSIQHDKVLSASLRFEFDGDGRLRVRLAGTRIGCLPVPPLLVRDRVEELKRTVVQRLLDSAGAGDAALDDPRSAGVARVLAIVVAAIDGKPIDPEVTWRLHARKRVRIDGIDIKGGTLTLHAAPAGLDVPGPVTAAASR